MSLRPSFFRHLNHPLFLLFLVFISYVAILALRIHNIEFRYGAFTDCRGCFIKPILIHEARLGGIWIILLAMGLYSARRAITMPLRFAVVAMLVIQIADVVLMSTLSSRLYIDSIGKVPVSPSAVFNFAHAWMTQYLGETGVALFILWAILIFIFLFNKSRVSSRVVAGMVVLGTLTSLCGFLIPDNSAYMLASTRENFIELNLPKGQHVPYSEAFKSAIQKPSQRCTCIKGRNSRKNIILLVVESLSNYQSNFFSGQMDLTPNLDRIAREHKSFTHFHANSFHTINSLEALLTGMPTIPSADEASKNLAISLPNYLKAYNYRTHYLTPAKFELLKNDGATLKAMGFDEIEGRTSFYDGAPELQFGSAPDDVFYQRALNALDDAADAARAQKNNSKAVPHFWVFMTGGTHQPFNRKNINNSSLPSAFRFADEELGQFYQALLKRNFFKNGVLIITGDHHSMTPITPEEYDRFGLEATSLVPLVIIEGEQPQPEIISKHFQQADLFQSIQFLIQKDVCMDSARGNLFGGEANAPECVFFERGDERDQVNFFCKDVQGTIRLDGDKTDFIGSKPPNAAAILNQLHDERLHPNWKNNLPDGSSGSYCKNCAR